MNTKRNSIPIKREWLPFAEGLIEEVGILDEDTADILTAAFASVPRDLFVPANLRALAKDDISLPIGYGQFSSKPSHLARMLGLIGLRPGMCVLEVGCGSGYLCAVMAAAGAKVFAVEKVGLLAQATRKKLDSLYHQNVIIRRCDGQRGWAEHAPYDAIILSTVFDHIEPQLISQLVNPSGRMVAAVGSGRGQILTLWEAQGGGVTLYQLEPCDFQCESNNLHDLDGH